MDNKGTDEKARVKAESGYSLSKKYCVSCHEYPSPDMLDTWTWKNEILPKMALRYGIYSDSLFRENEIAERSQGEGRQLVLEANVFPKEAIMSLEDWKKIEQYYLSKSSEKFVLPPRNSIPENNPVFRARIPEIGGGQVGSVLAKFRGKNEVIMGEADGKALRFFDKNLKQSRSIELAKSVVHAYEHGEDAYYLCMGQVFPTDDPLGLLIKVGKDGKKQVLIDKLQRPVSAVYDDFDSDGDLDVVIAEFGFHVGQLSLFLNDNGTFTRKKLNAKAGSMNTVLKDMNADGIKDVVVLSAQGDEGITVYYNDGKANFKAEKLLSFPPMYGSSYFEFVDLNGDSLDDILCTCGDNADYEPILKPYHGIYAFINKGNQQYVRLFFEYLNGAYAAKVHDFDGDGDLDMAAISFFPDYKNHPQESFVYYENQGNWDFVKSTIPEFIRGRWITMDMADWDGDGDQDLVLSHMFFPSYPENRALDERWQKQAPAFLVLENLSQN